jgi:hypothetical protein
LMGIGLAEEGSEETRRDTGQFPWGMATFVSSRRLEGWFRHCRA